MISEMVQVLSSNYTFRVFCNFALPLTCLTYYFIYFKLVNRYSLSRQVNINEHLSQYNLTEADDGKELGEIKYRLNDDGELTFDPVPKVILVFVHSIDKCHYVTDGIAFCNVYFLIRILDFGHVFRVLGYFQHFNDYFRYGTHVWRSIVGGSYLNHEKIVNLIQVVLYLLSDSYLRSFRLSIFFSVKYDDPLVSTNEILQKINNMYPIYSYIFIRVTRSLTIYESISVV